MFFDYQLTRHGAVGPQGGYAFGKAPKTISVFVTKDGVSRVGKYQLHLLAESLAKRFDAHSFMRTALVEKRENWRVELALCLWAEREVPWHVIRVVLRANAYGANATAGADNGRPYTIGRPTKIQVKVAGSRHHWDRRMLLRASYEESWDWDWGSVLDEDEELGDPEGGEGRYVIHLRRDETSNGPSTRIKIGDAVFDFPVGDAFEDSAFVGTSNRVWTRVAERLRQDGPPARVELSLRSGLTTPWAYVVKVLDLLNMAGVQGVFLPVSGAAEYRASEALRASLPPENHWSRPLDKPMVMTPTCLFIEFVALPPPRPVPRCGSEAEPDSKWWNLPLAWGAGVLLVLLLLTLAIRRRRAA